MSWLNKVANAVKETAKTVGIPIAEKTIDPRYTQAKETFKSIKIDTEKIIGSILQMENQIKALSQATITFGTDLNDMLVGAAPQSKAEAKSIETFGRSMDRITDTFLKQRLEPGVITPLSIFQKEVNRLESVKDKRRSARKEYDQARAKLKVYIDKKATPGEINGAQNESNRTFQKYTELNEDFIVNVNRLASTRMESLDNPFRNLSGILSQFILQICTEMQQLRSTFPPQTFAPRVPMTPVNAQAAAPAPAPGAAPVAAPTPGAVPANAPSIDNDNPYQDL